MAFHTIHENILTISVKKILEEQLQIKIFPNPTEGLINIESLDSEKMQILVVDQLGRILMQRDSEEQLTQLDLSNFPKGLYYLRVNKGGQVAVHKVVVF